MIDDISNYDPQLEIKVINLLFRLELYSPKIIYRKIKEILDFKNRWNIWLLGRNFYHVCYGRPRLIIPMCELASLARNDILKLSHQKGNNNANIEYEIEWNSALSISLITENDDFLSCAPPESVFFYGFLCNYKIVDPTTRLEAIEKKYNSYQDSNKIEKEIIIQTLLPLLLSCWDIFESKFPNFLNIILSFLQENINQDPSQTSTFNYKLIFSEIQNFIKMKCDMKTLTPFVLLQQSSSELEEQKDLYRKASERKASLIYQQKKAKKERKYRSSFDDDDDSFIEVEDEIDITTNGCGMNDGEEEEEEEANDNENECKKEIKLQDDEKIEDGNASKNKNDGENKMNRNESKTNGNENDNKTNGGENDSKTNGNENDNKTNGNENDNKTNGGENDSKTNGNENDNKSNDNDNESEDDDNFTLNSPSLSQIPHYLSMSHRLHRIISLDDVDGLQQMSVYPDFNFDFRVDTSLSCCYELLMKKPTLIQLSAFYGSLKCFKFLYLNKASLFLNDLNEEMPNSIASFAVSGGNIEIVRILISAKVDFSSSLFSSVSFHRDDLFFWFIENTGIEKLDINNKLFEGMSLMHFAAESNNLSIAQFLIESDIKIDFSSNYDEDNIETPFNLACNYDCVGIVELICDHFVNQIPREAVIEALSVCIASNSADSFAFLINFTEKRKSYGKCPFKLSLSEVRELKEKHGSGGFDELKQDCQIAKILNDFENKILSESKDQQNK